MPEKSEEKSEHTDKIVISKDTVYLTAVGVLFVLLVVSILTGGFGFSKPQAPANASDNAGNTNQNTSTGNGVANLPVVSLSVGELPPLGQTSAPITIIEFSDYQCPFCAKFHSQVETQLKTDYVSTGKAKLYFRDFPLSFHPNADDMANAARCAAEQGKFWEMHDKIFENQGSWSSLSEALVTSEVEKYASELGLNAETFKSCVSTKKYDSKVKSDLSAGTGYGVSGTPTTFIIAPQSKTDLAKVKAIVEANPEYYGLARDPNGNYVIMVVGAQPYSVFTNLLGAIST